MLAGSGLLLSALPLTSGSDAASPSVRASSPAVHLNPAVTLVLSEPIILKNNQAGATGANFDTRLIINSNLISTYINANWSNVQFAYPNGTTVPAWIESNATNTATSTNVWVDTVTIPANGQIRINMNVYATSDFLLNPLGPMGEAPQLSSTYAKFDDGRYVFPFYDNFKGSTLNTANWVSSFITGSATVNNGISTTSVQTGSASQAACGIIAAVQNVSGTYVIGVSVASAGMGDTSRFGPMSVTATGSSKCSTANSVISNFDISHAGSTTQYFVFHQTSAGSFSTDTVNFANWRTTSPYVFTQEQKSTQTNTAVNYTQNTGGFGNYNPGTTYAGLYLKANTGSVGNVNWFRERIGDPSSVAPSATFLPVGQGTANRTTCYVNCAVSFTGAASGGSGTFSSWSWDFGDGSLTSTSQSPTHTYTVAGSYTARMTVTDSNSQVGYTNISMTINSQPTAVAKFVGAAWFVLPSATAHFNGTASGGVGPYTWSWAFGDSGTSTSENPAHAYTGAGTYSVVLTVTDSGSQHGTSNTLTVKVNGTFTIVDATANPPKGVTPYSGTLCVNVTGGWGPYNYTWHLSFASTEYGRCVPLQLTWNGNYTENVTVTTSNGTQLTRTVFVNVTLSGGGVIFSWIVFGALMGVPLALLAVALSIILTGGRRGGASAMSTRPYRWFR